MILCKYPIILVFLFSLLGCISTARVSDFSKSSNVYDFDALSNINYESEGKFWNLQTKYEYFIEIDNVTEEVLFSTIQEALTRLGYKISYKDRQQQTIIGERGLQLNEWNSINGVYYNYRNGTFRVYIKNAITQDIIGGWRENRARRVAQVLCSELITCKKKN
jgi:hypothetical protein